MKNQLITRAYKDLTFTFRDDGYFNMTKAAKCFGKDLSNFMRSPETLEYTDALSVVFTDKKLVTTQRGSGLLPSVGTWAHPKLAIFFARWLDVRFAVWCGAMIEDILKGNAEALNFRALNPAKFVQKNPKRQHECSALDLPPGGPHDSLTRFEGRAYCLKGCVLLQATG